jgi:hypothetical protein
MPFVLELERARDFRFFAIDSVGHGGMPATKILNQAPLWVRELQGQNIYMSSFHIWVSIWVSIQFWGKEFKFDEIFKILSRARPVIDLRMPKIDFLPNIFKQKQLWHNCGE